MIGERVVNLTEYFAVIPANLGLIADYIGNNWAALVTDALSYVWSNFTDFGDNLRGFSTALWEFLQNPAGGFNFEWKNLGSSFEAQASELPTLIRPHLTSMQGEIDRKFAEIAAAEARRQSAAKPAEKPKGTEVTPLGRLGAFGTNLDAATRAAMGLDGSAAVKRAMDRMRPGPIARARRNRAKKEARKDFAAAERRKKLADAAAARRKMTPAERRKDALARATKDPKSLKELAKQTNLLGDIAKALTKREVAYAG
jgi:hypothetical protein